MEDHFSREKESSFDLEGNKVSTIEDLLNAFEQIGKVVKHCVAALKNLKQQGNCIRSQQSQSKNMEEEKNETVSEKDSVQLKPKVSSWSSAEAIKGFFEIKLSDKSDRKNATAFVKNFFCKTESMTFESVKIFLEEKWRGKSITSIEQMEKRQRWLNSYLKFYCQDYRPARLEFHPKKPKRDDKILERYRNII